MKWMDFLNRISSSHNQKEICGWVYLNGKIDMSVDNYDIEWQNRECLNGKIK